MVTHRMELNLDEDNPKLKFEWGTDDAEALRDFKCGIRLLRDQAYRRALAYFRRAHELERNNPYFLSYYGLALGLAEKQWTDAARLCESAVSMKRNQAQPYLNLAEVYLRSGKKAEAVEALEVGRERAPRDVRLRRMLQSLGIRRPAVLPFLARRHPLNRALGSLRHHLQFLLRRD